MSKIKLQIDWKKIFLGVVFLVGGCIYILVPASTLQDRSLIITIIFGITSVMLGTTFIGNATENFRERRKKQREQQKVKGAKDKKEHPTFK